MGNFLDFSLINLWIDRDRIQFSNSSTKCIVRVFDAITMNIIFETIEQIRKSGVTILLVEQNALAALRIADYAYVLESGHLKLEGDGSKLADDPAIAQAYLGG